MSTTIERPDMDIQDLVHKCLRNNAAAQRQLYEAFAPVMLGVCYRYTKQQEEAHDLLQEGFIRVFRHLDQWKGEGELGAWIRRIMINNALNWLRKQEKIQWLPETHINDQHTTPVSPTAIENMQARQLADIIRRLPTGFQTVFNLHAIEGYSHAEIATMLDISEGTSRSQYLRARRHLAEWIAQEYPEKMTKYAGRK